MCGRFALYPEPGQIKNHFMLEAEDDNQPSFNLAPTQNCPVILIEEGKRVLSWRRWGLVPHWSKGIDNRYSMINTRDDALNKPAWRDPIRHKRCLVPANGFYEWKKTTSGKQPYFIRVAGQPLFAMAGICDTWHPGEDQIDSFSIITTPSNELVGNLHDRMPLILAPSQYKQWLDPAISDLERVKEMIHPFPSESMEMYPVSTRVNSPRNNDADLIEPLDK